MAWSLGTAETNFTARLTADAPVTVSYSGSYLDKKSPTCGCYLATADEWRGISFMTKQLMLGPISSDQPVLSAYMLSASFPSTVKPYSTGFLLSAEYLKLRIPAGKVLDPVAVGNGMSSAIGYTIEEDTPIPLAPTVTLFTTGALFEESLGDAPIGAWVPAADARMVISRRAGSDVAGYHFAEIFDHLPSGATDAARRHFQEAGDVFTVVDYIGPKLVVWSVTPIDIFGGHGFHRSAAESTPNTIHALVIDVPFALRTTLGGLAGRDKTPRVAADDYRADGMMVDPITRGQVSGDLIDPLDSPLDYLKVRDWIENNSIVTGCGYSTLVDGGNGGNACMVFREPPLPQPDEVNVFGQIEKIEFQSVSGSLMVGANHREIDPSVPVQILKVNSYENPLGDLTIPIRISKHGIAVSNKFAAKGQITINGVPVSRHFDSISPTIGILEGVALFGTAITWALAWYVRRPKAKSVNGATDPNS